MTRPKRTAPQDEGCPPFILRSVRASERVSKDAPHAEFFSSLLKPVADLVGPEALEALQRFVGLVHQRQIDAANLLHRP